MVIDEALDIVAEARVDLERVKMVRAVIPESIAERYPEQMNGLAIVENLLRQMATVAKAQNQTEYERVLWRGDMKLPAEADMAPLRRELRNIRLDNTLLLKDPDQRKRMVASFDIILRDLQATLNNWNWYAKKLSDHTINTARLIVPDSIKGAAVLDATASSDVVYQLLEKAEVVPLPAEKARTYRNVTVHVSTGHSVGKSELSRETCARGHAHACRESPREPFTGPQGIRGHALDDRHDRARAGTRQCLRQARRAPRTRPRPIHPPTGQYALPVAAADHHAGRAHADAGLVRSRDGVGPRAYRPASPLCRRRAVTCTLRSCARSSIVQRRREEFT